MVKKKIDSIVFDLGGVLLTNDGEGLLWNCQKIKNLYGVSEEDLWKGWDAGWEDYKTGKITEDRFMEIFIKYANLPQEKSTIKVLKDNLRKKASRLPAFALLEKLKGKYKLFALSNIGKEWLEFKSKKFELSKYFVKIISSCKEKVAKPGNEIFKRFTSKTKTKPEKTIFIDDLEKSIQPAMKLGFNVILFKDVDQLTTELRKLGVKI